MIKFFPNQAADLEPVLALLQRLDAPARPTPSCPVATHQSYISRQLPQLLPPALLEFKQRGWTAQITAAAGDEAGGEAGRWEAQCVALAWLAQLVLLPFDLALLDSSLGEAAAGCVERPISTAHPSRSPNLSYYDLDRLTSTCSSLLRCASLWPGLSEVLAQRRTPSASVHRLSPGASPSMRPIQPVLIPPKTVNTMPSDVA